MNTSLSIADCIQTRRAELYRAPGIGAVHKINQFLHDQRKYYSYLIGSEAMYFLSVGGGAKILQITFLS